MVFKVVIIKHDVIHPQFFSFGEIMLSIPLDKENIPGTDRIGIAVDPVISAAGSDDDKLRKIVGMTDVCKVAFVLDRGVSADGAQGYGAAVFREKITSVGDDALHKNPLFVR